MRVPGQLAMLPQPNQPRYSEQSLPCSVLHSYAKRSQEAHILRRKRLTAFLSLAGFVRRLLLNFVQADRRLQHQKHIEPLLANVLHNSRNLRRFGD
jgi:hypothetical protein